jgi:hypothetical protein
VNRKNLNVFSIYFRELQEEAPMVKKHQKTGNKEYTGSPTLIYKTSFKTRQGERNS